MPLIYDKSLGQNTRILVWESIEDYTFFTNSLQLSSSEISELNLLRPHRKSEWLTSRYLCQLLDNKKLRREIIKDKHNKPYIQDSKKQISISHSKNRVAVIISNTSVGMDIQSHENKICRIRHKFISQEEHLKIDSAHQEESYHIFWGAKECMYKAYGLREIDFKEHMHLYPFQYYMPQLEIKGWLRKNNIKQDYDIYVDKIDDYYLVYSILNNEAV